MAVTLTSTGVQFPDNTQQYTGAGYHFRNKLINPAFTWATRNNTLSASATGSSGSLSSITRNFDPWGLAAFSGSSAAFTTTGTPNYTTRLGSAPNLGYMGFSTGTVTGIGGGNWLRQAIEGVVAAPLANKNVTISMYANAYPNITVSWELYYANTLDTWTITLGTGGSFTSGATLIGSGSWTLGTSPTVYEATVAVGNNAGNGLMLILKWPAVSNQSVSMSYVQLEEGSKATTYEYRHPESERILIGRYCPFFPSIGGSNTRNIGYGRWQSTGTTGTGEIIVPFNGQLARKLLTGYGYNGNYGFSVYAPTWYAAALSGPPAFVGSKSSESATLTFTSATGLASSGSPVPSPLIFGFSTTQWLYFTGAEL